MESKKYIAFTDGSCNNLEQNKYGGYAFIVFDYDNGPFQEIEQAVFSGSGGVVGTTNNIMELCAIISAAKAIPHYSEVVFVTDSQYCITVLDHKTKAFEKNMGYITMFRNVVNVRNLSYKFKWIRGHSGNKYNEYVDKMAVAEYNKIANTELTDLGFL